MMPDRHHALTVSSQAPHKLDKLECTTSHFATDWQSAACTEQSACMNYRGSGMSIGKTLRSCQLSYFII